ncbi:MAG TPA: PaaI family thioesterase [Sphingomicrobium sp.]|nr:PaaI family thioesterase [Sphingomicrobium sp.]
MTGEADLDRRCADSFGRQGLMRLLGAKLVEAANGRAIIEVPYREDLTQQHGYFHGGVVTAIADTACGYAAYTTMPADASVLTVEFKINLMNPAAGDLLRAEALVRKSGRTLVVVGATVLAIRRETAVPAGEMLGTFIVLRNTSDMEPRVLA